MNICIFEDGGWKNLYPLTLFRPAFELRCGFNLLREKIVRKFPENKILFLMRDHLVPTFEKRVPDSPVNNLDSLKQEDLLMINGRLLMDEKTSIPLEGDEEVGISGETIVYARLKKTSLEKCASLNVTDFLGKVKGAAPTKQLEKVFLITNLWDLINKNGEQIVEDFNVLGARIEGELSPQAAVVGEKSQLFIGKSAQIHPFVVLDTTGGPVIIDEDAIVYPHSRIEGPSCVGKKSKIVGGKVRECSSIGPVTMVGGEVEEIIFQGYANKFHDGFFGHSYICEWVNLGALATNSDIKNNYGPVKLYVNGELTNSGELKVGSFIGDHSKLGIGTLLNTGTVVGACSNIFSGGMPPKFVPSFSWGSGNKLEEFKLEKAIETAEKVLGRRKVKQTDEDVELIKKVYEITADERKKWGVTGG